MENRKSILITKLNVPTVICTVMASIPAALAAEGSDVMTKTLGWIADIIDVGISDVAHSITYNICFPLVYGIMNRKHYSPSGKFDFSYLFSELLLKVVPAGWTTAVFFFHLPRNVIQFFLMKKNFATWESSIIADWSMLIIYLPIRNLILKYFEKIIFFLKK